MYYLEEYTSHWKNLKLPDMLGILFILCVMLVTIASDILFKDFVQSKPPGRKTVLGKESNGRIYVV